MHSFYSWVIFHCVYNFLNFLNFKSLIFKNLIEVKLIYNVVYFHAYRISCRNTCWKCLKSACLHFFLRDMFLESTLLNKVRFNQSRRSNQSILKEISPEYSLEGLILKLKLQYVGHLMQRTDSWKDSDARKDWRREEKGTTENEMVGWNHPFDGHEFE